MISSSPNRRRSLLAWLAGVGLSAGPAQSVEAERMAVISLLGDQVTLVYAAAVTGSHLDRNRRRVLPDTSGALDRAALAAAGRAIEKARRGAHVALLAVPPSTAHQQGEAFVQGDVISLPDSLVSALEQSGASQLLLLTKLRAPAHIKLADAAVGVGQLEGLGYYVDRAIHLREQNTGDQSDGMLVAYAYVQLTLADARTGQVLRRQGLRATQVHTATARPDVGDPWDLLDAQQKAGHLRSLLERQLAREIPALLAA